jgi:hypothetical protein
MRRLLLYQSQRGAVPLLSIMAVLLPGFSPAVAMAELPSLYRVHEILEYFPSYPNVNSVLIGDFDGDGVHDLLLWSPTVGLAILPGLKGGGFGAHIRKPQPGVRTVQAVQDWNGDGLDDVLGAYQQSPFVGRPFFAAILPGHPTDYLGPALITVLPAEAQVAYWRDADLDGRLDLLYGLPNGEWHVRPARGSSLAPPVRVLGLPGGSELPIFRDFDSDGVPDVVFKAGVLDPRGPVTSFAAGSAPFSFHSQELITTSWGTIGAVLDIDGDNRLDLIHRIQEGFEVFSWTPGNRFPRTATRPLESLAGGGAVISDLDGDGYPDWIFPDFGGGKIKVIQGNGTPAFGSRRSIPSSTYPRSVTVGPFGADGRTGLAVLIDGTPALFEYPRPMEIPRLQEIPLGWPNAVIAMDGHDLDGDGVNELLTVTSLWARPDSLRVLAGRGDFHLDETGVLGLPAEVFRAQFADFTGDGRIDCLTAGENPMEYSVFPGVEEAPYFSEPAIRSPLLEPIAIPYEEPLLVVAIDHDGDGDADVLQAHPGAGVLRYYRNDGTGRLTPVAYWLVQGGLRAVAPFDVESTPGVETLVLDRASGRIRLLSLDTQDIVTEVWSRPTVTGMRLLQVLSVDGDPYPDVVVAAMNSNKTFVHRGLGDGSLADPVEYRLPGPVIAFQGGDLDGDGIDELAGIHRNKDLLRVGAFPGEHGQLAAAEYGLGTVGGVWSLIDLTGDGAAEFVGERGYHLGAFVSWNDFRREDPPPANPPGAAQPFRVVAVTPQPASGPVQLTISGGRPGLSFTARVFSVTGRSIVNLEGMVEREGRYEIRWDGNCAPGQRCPGGIYFARIQHADRTATTRIVLVR